MESPHEISPQKNKELSLQERALAYGMLHSKKGIVVSYTLDKDNNRIHPHTDLGAKGFNILVDEFRNNPKDYLAIARENLFSIMKDPKLNHQERLARLSRYLDAYFKLQVKLDNQAFPPSEKVFNGIPDYIPDGLSDMGSDPDTNPESRTREKIRVNKLKILAQSKNLFTSIFSYDFLHVAPQQKNEEMKKLIAEKVGLYIYNVLPYDYNNKANMKGYSVPITNYRERQLAVCRQQALYTQVLLQAFGLTSKLMKSHLSFNNGDLGSHVNNLIRINYQWFILDVTNPEELNPQRSVVFVKPVKEADIDLNKNKYNWTFNNGYEIRSYATRSNMYYRIRDNVKDPLK
jgi:hypothetical protein